jgi:Rieske Fe-S protein
MSAATSTTRRFEVRRAGETHVFDSFECAIQALAPVCEHCGCRVIGHGVEADERIFCCANCAAQAGVAGLADRA